MLMATLKITYANGNPGKEVCNKLIQINGKIVFCITILTQWAMLRYISSLINNSTTSNFSHNVFYLIFCTSTTRTPVYQDSCIPGHLYISTSVYQDTSISGHQYTSIPVYLYTYKLILQYQDM